MLRPSMKFRQVNAGKGMPVGFGGGRQCFDFLRLGLGA
jgi:hypothetical protein